MKTKTSKHLNKTFVQQVRDVRDNINVDIKDLTLEQLKKYLKKKKTLHDPRIWQ